MEMTILIKKGVFIQQQLFMVISVLQIKGKLITCKIIYLLPTMHNLYFYGQMIKRYHITSK